MRFYDGVRTIDKLRERLKAASVLIFDQILLNNGEKTA